MARRAAPKPRTGKLKVFVTPIGFHDAYVAAPSQAAALKAWGASANLFARGVAAVVTDAKLAAPALAAPGEVVKVPRGTTAEHIAALGKVAATPKARGQAADAEETEAAPEPRRKGRVEAKPKPEPRPTPRPRRDALERAEAALAALEDAQRAERRDLDRREAELARERKALEREQAKGRAKLETAREKAAAAYARALEKWRG